MGYMKNQGISKMLKGGSGGKPGSSFAVTKWFLDAPAVVNAVDKATRRVLSRFGAYVRRTMKTSIRQSKKTSAPGSPPRSHAGLLKKFIFFAFDPASWSVVIGPERLNAKVGNVPEVLEHGGRNTVATYRRRGRKRLVSKRTVNIKARPYARPALEKEQPKLPAMWADSVRR